jgi:hypothetical protein
MFHNPVDHVMGLAKWAARAAHFAIIGKWCEAARWDQKTVDAGGAARNSEPPSLSPTQSGFPANEAMTPAVLRELSRTPCLA